MPQPFNSSDELSLRHLPDVSDSSFSFQIPGPIRDDNLLADDDLDFFKGADVSIVPLASPPTTTEPLSTFTQPEKLPSSPKNERKLGSFPTLSYDHSEDHDTNPKQKKANLHQLSKVTNKPKPKVITSTAVQLPSCEGSPAAVRLDNIRVELNLLSDNLFAGSSKNIDLQEFPAAIYHRPKGILRKSLEKKQLQQVYPRNNQKVTEGRISKTRYTTKLSSITCHPDAADTLPIPQKQVNGDHSFADSSMDSIPGGVAGRLVMYSQKLINSFGPLHPERSLEPLEPNDVCISQDQTVTDVDPVKGQASHEADRVLTLSQLSPQKAVPSRDPTPTPRNNVSPIRLPSKRPISVALQKRKKSKTDASSADVSVPKPALVLRARLPVAKGNLKPIFNSSSELRLNRSTKRKPTSTRVNGPGIKRPPVFKPDGPKLITDDAKDDNKDVRVVSSTSSSRCATSANTSGLKNSNEKHTDPLNSITLSKGKSIVSFSQGSSRATYHAAQPATKSVPFNFQTSRRGPDDQDVNKGTNDNRESQSEKRLHSSLTIPNFKAMHAAQEAELALRKENIQPVVPLPIRWETDHRLKERRKFDERMREIEREKERLMELRREEREEQEEREVRELRKKAVPKAHEVPEWYKEAPKKKRDNAIVGSDR